MKFKTKNFGKTDMEKEEVIEFIQPVLGFEKYRFFAKLHSEAIGESICWLQSTDEPELCFVLVNARSIENTYTPSLPGKALEALGENPELWVIFTPANGTQNYDTVNLKSPIAIKNGKGIQIVLNDDYPLREPIDRRMLTC